MMTTLQWALLCILFSFSLSHAATYEMTIDRMRSVKCAQKIHDYFEKNYTHRVQNLKIDIPNSKITFDSISIDSIELENIKNGLNLIDYKVIEPIKPLPAKDLTKNQPVEKPALPAQAMPPAVPQEPAKVNP